MQKELKGQLRVLGRAKCDEMDQLIAGEGYGGSRPRSITECFAMLIPNLLAWLTRAEAILPPLSRDLRNGRRMLGFCHFARQECDQATVFYEKAAETERDCFPLFSHHRIGTLKHLIKSLALQGQGATALFDELVEEMAILKRINDGAGNEDSVGGESIKPTCLQVRYRRHWHVEAGEVDGRGEGGGYGRTRTRERARRGGRKWKEKGVK